MAENKRWTFTIDGEKHDVMIDYSYRSEEYGNKIRESILNTIGDKYGFDSYEHKERYNALSRNPTFPDIATSKVIVDGEIIQERESKTPPYDIHFDVGNEPAVMKKRVAYLRNLNYMLTGNL